MGRSPTQALTSAPTRRVRTDLEQRLPRSLRVVSLLALLILAGCNSDGGDPEPVIQLPASQPLEPAPRAERLRAQLDLAEGYIEIEEYPRARAALDRALDIDARNWEAHDLYGRIYQLQGEPELAERHFRLAIRADGDNARVRNDYGVFLYQQARYDEAVSELERAASDPDSPRRALAFENLGLASLAAERRAQAREAFLRAVQLGDRMPLALLELAELAFDDADYARSAGFYQRFLDIITRQSPRSLWLGIRLARIAGDEDAEASYSLQLKNLFPYSEQHLRLREERSGG